MDLLAEVKAGNAKSFVTADAYLRSILPCFVGDGMCPTKLFALNKPEEWDQAMKHAGKMLTYADKEGAFSQFLKAAPDGSRPLSLSPGSILDFDAIITTTRKDRDGDILEAAGMQLDPNAPLLWQHIPVQPIGKCVAKTMQTKDVLAGRFSIFDTDLGRDAAVLVEGGALRISHGFEPIEFKPLEAKGGRWHIMKAQIVEVSLVSVPANTDAVIQSYSRNKSMFRSPIVKSWAQKLFDERPVVVQGADVGSSSPAPAPVEKPACACGKTGGECSCNKKVGRKKILKALKALIFKMPSAKCTDAFLKDCKALLVKVFGEKADALQECVSNKIKVLMDEGKYDQNQAIAIAYSYCGEKDFATKRPIDMGPQQGDSPAGDMTMGPQQGGDTDWKPHREVVRRIEAVGSQIKSAKPGVVYMHPSSKALHHTMSPEDRPDVDAANDPNGYHSAREIKAMYEAAFAPVAKSGLDAGGGGVSGPSDGVHAQAAPFGDQPSSVTVSTDHPGGFKMVKSGREISAANLSKLGMAKDHLDAALSKPDHFHPIAHTLVTKAHGIVSGMCSKEYKGFDMPASPLYSDDQYGGALQTSGQQVDGYGPGGGNGRGQAASGAGGQLVNAPRDKEQPQNAGTTTPTDGYANQQRPTMPQMFDVNHDESTGERVTGPVSDGVAAHGAPFNTAPSNQDGVRAQAAPFTPTSGPSAPTPAQAAPWGPGSKMVFNWERVGGILLLEADDNPEKARALYEKLGAKLRQIETSKQIDILYDGLVASQLAGG